VAAVAVDDDSTTGGDDRSQAEEVDMDLLSSDPEVQEEQLRALDEERGRPAKVGNSVSVATKSTSATEGARTDSVGVMQRSRGRPPKQPARGRGRKPTQGNSRRG
jgi:hypothetical protein